MTRSVRQLVVSYSALRAAYAAGLIAAPGRVARPWLGDVRRASAAIPTRGVGARELALSAGAVAAVRSRSAVRPWLVACAVSDVADILATLAADADELPSRSKLGTVLAAGTFAAAALVLSRRADA